MRFCAVRPHTSTHRHCPRRPPARILKLKAEKPTPSGPPAPTPRTGATIQGERGQRPGPEGAGPCLTRAVATRVGVSIRKSPLSFELRIFTLRHTSVTENKAHPGRFLAGLHTVAQTATGGIDGHIFTEQSLVPTEGGRPQHGRVFHTHIHTHTRPCAARSQAQQGKPAASVCTKLETIG